MSARGGELVGAAWLRGELVGGAWLRGCLGACRLGAWVRRRMPHAGSADGCLVLAWSFPLQKSPAPVLNNPVCLAPASPPTLFILPLAPPPPNPDGCRSRSHREIDAKAHAKTDEELQAETEKAEQEGDAGEAAALAPLPFSGRASQTAERTRLIFKGFALIKPPPTPAIKQAPPAVQAQTENEFTKICKLIATCRQSDQEARDLLDKETFERIFKTPAVAGKGRGGGATRSAGGCTRGGGGEGGGGEEKLTLKRVEQELHRYVRSLV